MAEYIKREDAKRALLNTICPHEELPYVIDLVPSADVVERKHGKWIWQLADNGWADNICSACGYTINDDVHVHVDYNFCPNCGADMRGEE